MKTGSFFTTADLAGRISIARWAPKGFRDLPRLSALAPGPWFKSVDIPTYEKLYAKQLAKLHPGAIWDQLHVLAGSDEPVILCWEKPGHFCHRRLVADWFADTVGEIVDEHLIEEPQVCLTLASK